MELIILGSAAAYAGPDEACSGCLVRSGDTSVVIDLGNGTLSELFKHMDPADLDAIIITHAHIDHFADLFSLKQYLRYNEKKPRITVYAPEELIRKLDALSADSLQTFELVFDLVEISGQQSGHVLKLGDLVVSLYHMPHFHLEAFGVLVHHSGAAKGEHSLFLTGDTTAVGENVSSQLRDKVHTVLAEATLRDSDRPNKAHMSGSDAGLFASDVKAKQLIMTHFWAAFERTDRLTEAATVYDGEIFLASRGNVFKIP